MNVQLQQTTLPEASDLLRRGQTVALLAYTDAAPVRHAERVLKIGHRVLWYLISKHGSSAVIAGVCPNPPTQAHVLAAQLHMVSALAWLHDVCEDTPWTVGDLWELGGIRSAYLLTALESITRRKDETYRKYIDRVTAGNALARIVKTADVIDRLTFGDCKSCLRHRYGAALVLLARSLRVGVESLLCLPD